MNQRFRATRSAPALAALLCATTLAGGPAFADEPAGLVVEAGYIGEVIRNAGGGLERGTAYLDRLDLALSGTFADAGVQFRVNALYTNGTQFSERYSGDAMAVSNIDADGALRLYEAWLEWSPGGSRGGSVRAGLYDLNSEFDTSDVRATFANSAFGIGHEIAQTGAEGPSIFPNTALGVRGAWALGDTWRVQAVALDAVPGRDGDPASLSIRLGDGALLAAEVQRFGTRLTKAAVGAWSYTRATGTLLDEAATRRNRGAYASFDVDVASHADGRGTAAFLRAGRADPRVNEYDGFVAVGVVHRFDRDGRERALGLGAALARASNSYRDLLVADGGRPARSESVLELTFRAGITDWLTLHPHVQYVVHPAANRTLDDAFVVGLRFEVGVANSLGGF